MNASGQRIRVWDLPTRVFHWTLVVCVVGAFASVKAGTLWMDWHVRFGLAVLALIAFRLVWGVVGPHHARFSNFLRGPSAIKRYLADRVTPALGHNPLGGWSVIAMLALFGFQAISGLFTTDDILTSGPLAHVDSGWSATLTNLHKATEWWMIALVALHIATVLGYQWVGKQNLVGPMVHGDVIAPPQVSVPASRDTWASRLAALILIAAISGGVWWLSTLGSGAGAGMDFM
jgi:cytochrome b